MRRAGVRPPTIQTSGWATSRACASKRRSNSECVCATLTARYRYVERLTEVGVARDVFGPHGLFEPLHSYRFEFAADAAGVPAVVGVVRVDHHRRLRSNGLANAADEFDVLLEAVPEQFEPDLQLDRAEGVGVPLRLLANAIVLFVEVGDGLEVVTRRVRSHRLAPASAEQRRRRDSVEFSGEIPQRDIDPAHRRERDDRLVGRPPDVVEAIVEPFDAERVFTEDVGSEHLMSARSVLNARNGYSFQSVSRRSK